MKLAMIGTTILALAFSGCAFKKNADDAATQASTATEMVKNHVVTTDKFECNNGLTVTVVRTTPDQIQLTTQQYRAVMNQAVSGSGERFVATQGLYGYGGEWHQSGDEAHFSYKGVHGKHGETSCNLLK